MYGRKCSKSCADIFADADIGYVDADRIRITLFGTVADSDIGYR